MMLIPEHLGQEKEQENKVYINLYYQFRFYYISIHYFYQKKKNSFICRFKNFCDYFLNLVRIISTPIFSLIVMLNRSSKIKIYF